MCVVFTLDTLYPFIYKKVIEQTQPLIMFRKSLYLTIVLPLIYSGTALADKTTLKEHLTELRKPEYTEVQDA